MSFVLVVNIRIKPDSVDKFMQGLKANAREARKEPGCRQFEVLVDPKDSTKIMLFEVYDDEKAFEAFRDSYRGKSPERFRLSDMQPGA